MRYFARNKFSRSLAHKRNFGLIWHVVFKLGYLFVKGGRLPLLSLNELGEKSQSAITLGKFSTKSQSNSYWLIVFGKCFSLVKIKACSQDVFFSWSFDLILINSGRYLLFGVYFSLGLTNCIKEISYINANSKGNQLWNENKETNIFMLFFSQFYERIFLKVIKQPFRRGANLNRFLKKCPCYYVLIIFLLNMF